MIRIFSRSVGTLAQLFSIFGGEDNESHFNPPVLNGANAWIPRNIDLYSAGINRESALGSGNQITLTWTKGGVDIGNITMDNADGTSVSKDYAPVVWTKSDDDAVADAILGEHIVDTGSPSAEGTIQIAYQDQLDHTLSYHQAGDGDANLTVGATPEFLAVNGAGTAGSTTEAAAQVVWPGAGSLGNFNITYRTDAATTYDVEVRINGSASKTISLTADTVKNTVNDTGTVSISAGDLLAFRVVRTAGAGSLFECCLVFTYSAG